MTGHEKDAAGETKLDPGDEVSPAEFTRRRGDKQASSAGPGAPETVEPTQGHDDGPSGPPQRDLGGDGES